MTIMGWAKTTQVPFSEQAIFGRWIDANNNWFFGYFNNDRVQARIGGLSIVLNSLISYDIENMGWTHHTYMYNRTHLSVYTNGNFQTSQAVTGTPNGVNSPLYIGSRSPTEYFWKGEIDDVKIWNRALSLDEIQRESKGNFCAIG